MNPVHEWIQPDGDYPGDLWPKAFLGRLNPEPSGWVVIEESFVDRGVNSDTHSIMATAAALPGVMEEAEWYGQPEIGDFSYWSGPRGGSGFDDGLAARLDQGEVLFFSGVREHQDFVPPTVDFTHPFIWFWDAFPTDQGWSYLDGSGRDAELIRSRIGSDGWKVEVSALELRTFLAVTGRVLVVQIDHMLCCSSDRHDRFESSFRQSWFHLDWVAGHERGFGDLSSSSRLLGKYIVQGALTVRRPQWMHSNHDCHPEFIIGVDKGGMPVRFTCEPDRLANYFGANPEAPHYLTPVNFKREVLTRYAVEPHRYAVSATRLSCLRQWSLSISINTADLVSVYLGDLGRDLPASERQHWLVHNVIPEGDEEEGRVRRDLLNQFASSPDPIGELHQALASCNATSAVCLGTSLWKPMPAEDQLLFDRLVRPVSEHQSALMSPILILTKALIDAIDVKALKSYLGNAQPDEKGLSLLARLARQMGDEDDCVEVLRALQDFRSTGGAAHLTTRKAGMARARLGIEGMDAPQAFDHVATSIRQTLESLQSLMAAATAKQKGERTDSG